MWRKAAFAVALTFLMGASCQEETVKRQAVVIVPQCECRTGMIQIQVKPQGGEWSTIHTGPVETKIPADQLTVKGIFENIRVRCVGDGVNSGWVEGFQPRKECK